jgi:riboflavin synthase
MFTGIIENQGIVEKKSASSLKIKAHHKLIKQLNLGVSISVNGACLTVRKIPSKTSFEADVMPETFKKTMLGKLTAGSIVNLELPLKANGRFGGHIVQGHVDGTATVKTIKQQGNSRIINFIAPKKLLEFMVEKGSVAINGISLTLIEVTDKSFSVGIIPHTWENTMLKSLKVKDEVNIELDILAKYINKLL